MDEPQLKALADTAAAVLTKVHKELPLPDGYIRGLLHYCHYAVQDIGYSVETVGRLEGILRTGGGSLVIVPPQQNLWGDSGSGSRPKL